jgi:hypothetical protein
VSGCCQANYSANFRTGKGLGSGVRVALPGQRVLTWTVLHITRRYRKKTHSHKSLGSQEQFGFLEMLWIFENHFIILAGILTLSLPSDWLT